MTAFALLCWYRVSWKKGGGKLLRDYILLPLFSIFFLKRLEVFIMVIKYATIRLEHPTRDALMKVKYHLHFVSADLAVKALIQNFNRHKDEFASFKPVRESVPVENPPIRIKGGKEITIPPKIPYDDKELRQIAKNKLKDFDHE